MSQFPHINSNTPAHFLNDHLSYFLVVRGNNGNTHILFNAFNDEIKCFGSSQVSDHGIECNFYRQELSGGEKNDGIDDDNNIADRCTQFLTEIDSKHFRTIDHGSASYCKTDPRAEKESAKYCYQQGISGNIFEFNIRQHEGKTGNGQHGLNGKLPAQCFVGHYHKRNIETDDQQVQWNNGKSRYQ